MVPVKFCFILEIDQPEQELSMTAVLVNGLERKEQSYWRTQELPMAAMFLMDQDEMINLYRGPSIDASYQVSVHVAKHFQRRRFKCEKLTDEGCQVMVKAHMAFHPREVKCYKLYRPSSSSVVGGFSDKDSTLTVVGSTPWTNITFFLAIPLMKNE